MINKNIKPTRVGGFGEWYEFHNKKGERILVEIHVTHADPKSKNSLPNLWKKHGFIKEAYYDYINISVYVYDEKGCWSRYNPQHTKEHKINFKWLLPESEANKHKLLNEVYRLANK